MGRQAGQQGQQMAPQSQPQNREKLQMGLMALGQSLAGGNGLGYISNEMQDRRRIEQAGADRVLRNYQLQQAQGREDANRVRDSYQRQQQMGREDKRYEEGIARAGQYRAEDLARADIEGMNRRNDAALGMEREDKQSADRLAMEARRADLAEIEALNRQNTAMLGFDAEQKQFGQKIALDQRQLDEVTIPRSNAEIAALGRPKAATVSLRQMAVADPQVYEAARQEAYNRFDSDATDEDIMAIMVRMKQGGTTPTVKPTVPLNRQMLFEGLK